MTDVYSKSNQREEDNLRLFDLMQDTLAKHFPRTFKDEEKFHPYEVKTPNVSTKDIVIAGLTSDSRKVRPGFLFAAFKGTSVDGRDYIRDAIENGAVAILTDPDYELPSNAGGVELIEDPNPRQRFARMCARFYNAQPETIVGVTGTNGKTSTVNFLQQIWTLLGRSSASMGTLGIQSPDVDPEKLPDKSELSHTTPDPVVLHQAAHTLAKNGVTDFAIEASSHGLEQHRLDGLKLSCGAFTNLSRDHIDYHGDMSAYFKAKAKLFSDLLQQDAPAIINIDQDYGERMARLCRDLGLDVITYGRAEKSNIRLLEQTPTPHGQDITFKLYDKDYSIHLPIVGTFQALNVLCAVGIVTASMDENKYDAVIDTLSDLKGVRGRTEWAGKTKTGASVYVDYAHTPDALETVLKAMRPHATGRLGVVFGCGGDRDRGKRPMMGQIAIDHADFAIVTDDNPRTENPQAIRKDIMAACKGGIEVGNRRDAIEYAINKLADGDVLVVAGKGHEQGQTIDSVVYPFDDVTEVQRAIKRQK